VADEEAADRPVADAHAFVREPLAQLLNRDVRRRFEESEDRVFVRLDPSGPTKPLWDPPSQQAQDPGARRVWIASAPGGEDRFSIAGAGSLCRGFCRRRWVDPSFAGACCATSTPCEDKIAPGSPGGFGSKAFAAPIAGKEPRAKAIKPIFFMLVSTKAPVTLYLAPTEIVGVSGAL
jgi:hypothetical protein